MQIRFLALLQGAFATAAIAQPDSGGIDFSRFPWKAPGLYSGILEKIKPASRELFLRTRTLFLRK
jgi:hypothetical protein